MPNLLGTVLFPAALDTAASLIPAANNAGTTLSVNIPSSGDPLAEISVDSTADFPDSGALSIDDEILFYESKTNETFTQCHRAQDGTVAAAHQAGAVVELRIVAAFHTAHSNALIAVETKLGSNDSHPDVGKLLQGNAEGTSDWSDHIGLGTASSSERILNLAGSLSASSGQQAGAWIAPTFESSSTNELYGLHLAPSFAAHTTGTDSMPSPQVSFYALNSNPNIDSNANIPVTSFSNILATFQQNSGSTVGSYRGVFVRNPTGLGNITTAYGVYIEGITKGTNNYGVYSAGGQNYFAGATGIGTTPNTASGLNLAATFTAPGVTPSYGLQNTTNVTLSASATSWVGYGESIALAMGSDTNIGTLCGLRISSMHNGGVSASTTITNHIGIQVGVRCSSNGDSPVSTNVTGGTFGISRGLAHLWTVGTAKILEVTAPVQSSGTIVGTNLYGFYMGDFAPATGSGSWTNQYALYITGGKSYHAGSFGIGTNAPHSSLHVSGSFATFLNSKTGNYTLTALDSVLLVNAGSSASINLPDASGIAGRRYTVKRLNASVTLYPATGSSQTIDGAASYALANQYDRVTVVSNGSNWFII